MKTFILEKSTRKDKKLMVTTPEKRIIHFGAKGYSDYTIHKDDNRRQRYLKRHSVNENWDDLNSAGMWAKEILWGVSPDISKCIRHVEKRFKIKIVNNL